MRDLVKLLAVLAASVALVSGGREARAEYGTSDAVPAATLLLPYFEVDLGNPNGLTTLLSVNNASAQATVAHVTLWTDRAIPTVNFDIYLTGYDVQTINLRDVFNGNLPRTADSAADPSDNISNDGSLSDDTDFPGGGAGIPSPCGANADIYPVTGALDAATVAHIGAAHTGNPAPNFGGFCAAHNFGDNTARGYVTIDNVNTCNLLFPSDAGYFIAGGLGIANDKNTLWGDFFMVDSANNFAQGDALVHIEACDPAGFTGFVGDGGSHCPVTAGDQTFYGRYLSGLAVDEREPLATTYMARYLNGGAFTGGTDLLVWRDTKVSPSGGNGPRNCALKPNWYPLPHSDVVAFDEQENPTNLCFLFDNVAPAIGGEQPCFPLAAQRLSTAGSSLAPDLVPPATFGMLYMNFNNAVPGDIFPGISQAWVSTVMDASGRFSVGLPAVQLDNALTANPGGVLLIP